jgi:hypothetical protein
VGRRQAAAAARGAELPIPEGGRPALRRAPEPLQLKLLESLRALPAAELAAASRALVTVARELSAAAGVTAGPTPMFFED